MNQSASVRRAPTARRTVLRTGLGGLAVTLGSAIVPARIVSVAFAQEGGEGAETTTTTEPAMTEPELLGFLQSIELAIVATYDAILAAASLEPAVADLLTSFRQHHQDHADALGTLADTPVTRPNPIVANLVEDQLLLAEEPEEYLELAVNLENTAAATHLTALEVLRDDRAQRLVASILPVDGQHAVVLGAVLGSPLIEVFPAGGPEASENRAFETVNLAVEPEAFPINPTTTTTAAPAAGEEVQE